MKKMSKKGNEITKEGEYESEYTEESESEEENETENSAEEEDSSSEEEEKRRDEDSDEEKKEDTQPPQEDTIKKKQVGLLIERPVGWTTKGVIPRKLGYRKSRACVLTLNTFLLILSLCALQVICLYRDMCTDNGNPTVPRVISLSVVPLTLGSIILVFPLGTYTSISKIRSKVWGLHLLVSASFCIVVFVMIIIGAVEYMDIIENKSCTMNTLMTNCTKWDDLSSKQKGRFQNDEGTFLTDINRNGAAIGIFACIGCLICALDVLISSFAMCAGRDDSEEEEHDTSLGLPLSRKVD